MRRIERHTGIKPSTTIEVRFGYKSIDGTLSDISYLEGSQIFRNDITTDTSLGDALRRR